MKLHLPYLLFAIPAITCLAGLDYSDIVKWGLVRRTDLPASAVPESPCQGFTTNLAAIAGNCTVTYACGSLVRIVADASPTVIAFNNAGFPTNGVARVAVELWAGANTVVFDAATISNSAAVVVSPDAWTSLFFRRVADGALWEVRQ